MDIFAGASFVTPVIIMHNITKIKLFRILLRITYLPSLIILYPLAFWRRKSKSGLFFFFDRYAMGGAQRIHLDILKSIPESEKEVFFTRWSSNKTFKKEFYTISNAECRDIHIWCDYLLFRLFSVHYFSFYINRHSSRPCFWRKFDFFLRYASLYQKKSHSNGAFTQFHIWEKRNGIFWT